MFSFDLKLLSAFIVFINWTLSTIFWAIFSIISAILRSKESLTHVNINQTEQETLRYLNYQINSKSARLQLSLEKIKELKRTISALAEKRGKIQSKYDKLVAEFKNELAKSEFDRKALRSQIERMTRKKHRMQMALRKLEERKHFYTFSDFFPDEQRNIL